MRDEVIQICQECNAIKTIRINDAGSYTHGNKTDCIHQWVSEGQYKTYLQNKEKEECKNENVIEILQ